MGAGEPPPVAMTGDKAAAAVADGPATYAPVRRRWGPRAGAYGRPVARDNAGDEGVLFAEDPCAGQVLVWLVGKARSKELSLGGLSPKQQALFERSMAKE